MKHIIHFILFCSLFFGCKSDPTSITVNKRIYGKVALYNDEGMLLEDNSGVQVSLVSSTKSSSTVTTYDGSWVIENLSTDLYTIEFSKHGYFSTRYFNIKIEEEKDFRFSIETLPTISPVVVEYLEISKIDSSATLHITGSISKADSLKRVVEIIFSKEPFIDMRHIPYLFSWYAYLDPDSTNFSSCFPAEYYHAKYKFQTGTKLYCAAFPYPRKSWSGCEYYNDSTKLYEVGNIGLKLSNIVTVIAP